MKPAYEQIETHIYKWIPGINILKLEEKAIINAQMHIMYIYTV